MSRKLQVYLAVVLGWACVAGVLLRLTGLGLDSLGGAVAIALLYMPSPMVAALIAERGLRRDRLGLPRRRLRQLAAYFLTPVAVVVAFVLLYLAAVVLTHALGIDSAGQLAMTQELIMDGAAAMFGQDAVDAAGPPPSAAVLLLAGLGGALVAGWTINGLVAMGEEYGWRGLMWDQLQALGVVRANLFIGLAWGLWHAPLIVQGYNYPQSPALGVLAMAVLCTGMSLTLTALRELTGSLLPVAATHGMFNGVAPILILLTPGAHRILTGPIGLLAAAIFALHGALGWAVLHRRTTLATSSSTTDVPSGESRRRLASWATSNKN